ncbi:MAG: transcription antitermination factor NusB [Sideroxyarcus sp.]|nr:transcription antitermination factor NusB [Sideroxyarcus sp.]
MKSARRRSRELALQGLYSWLLAGQPVSDIAAQLEESKGFERADHAYFSSLMRGAIEQQGTLEEALAPCLDRKVRELSPVERGILLLGAWELKNAPDVPYRVVINEAVELAKSFGGTDGHKYVNGVLDKLAKSLREREARAGV